MGTNIDRFVTSTEHAAIDHTGITGVSVPSPYVQVQNNGGATEGPQPTINFIPSGAAGMAVANNPGMSRIDVTVSATAEAFTSGVHAATDHSGITGVGSSYTLSWHTAVGSTVAATGAIRVPGDSTNNWNGVQGVPSTGRVTKIAVYRSSVGVGQCDIVVNGTTAIAAMSNAGGPAVASATLGSPVAVSAGGTITVGWINNTGTVSNMLVTVFVEP